MISEGSIVIVMTGSWPIQETFEGNDQIGIVSEIRSSDRLVARVYLLSRPGYVDTAIDNLIPVSRIKTSFRDALTDPAATVRAALPDIQAVLLRINSAVVKGLQATHSTRFLR